MVSYIAENTVMPILLELVNALTIVLQFKQTLQSQRSLMKIAQLKALAKRGESENLEFKASTANLNAGMQTVNVRF